MTDLAWLIVGVLVLLCSSLWLLGRGDLWVEFEGDDVKAIHDRDPREDR